MEIPTPPSVVAPLAASTEATEATEATKTIEANGATEAVDPVEAIDAVDANGQRLRFWKWVTADGSPTVRIGAEDREPETASEAMHSLKGAFSETVYIYGTALVTALENFERGFPPRVLSLGLGLGYVELLAAGLILKRNQNFTSGSVRESFLASVQGESFESIPQLRDWFVNWLAGHGETPEEFTRIYDHILQRTAQEVGIPAPMIKTSLASWVMTGQWRIRAALEAHTEFSNRFGCICFDAFSSKTSPELWTEAFLIDFLARACAEKCVLSTYACTGALKRGLRTSGFEITIREGFSSKRDSTFAVRK